MTLSKISAASTTKQLQRVFTSRLRNFATSSSIDDTWEQRRGVAAAEAWSTIVSHPSSSAVINNSIDDTWEQRRGIAEADTWASNNLKPPLSSFMVNNSIDESWEQRRDAAAADAWASKINRGGH